MMLQWTDTTAVTQGDMERGQEMTDITDDDRKWATWWLQQKRTRREASGHIATISFFMLFFLCVFFFILSTGFEMPWKEGGGMV